MKIFVYTSVHRWNDSRIFHKEVRSLASQYRVEYHAPAEFTYKEFENIRIFGLPVWRSRKDRVKTFLKLISRLLKSNADIYHFHDPELLITSIIPFIKGKKVVFDVHENIREQIHSKPDLSRIWRIFFSFFYGILENIFKCFIKKFVLAESSYREIYNPQKSEIILNLPILVDIEQKPIIKGKIVYIGNWIRFERGAKELVGALKILDEKGYDFQLHWIGDFHLNSREIEEIPRLISDYNLQNKIIFYGRIDYQELFPILQGANAGFSCLHPLNNFKKSYPTKIFEYMMSKVPVICSDFPFWEEVVIGYNCGLCVNPMDPNEIAGAMMTLIDNQEMVKTMGENGRKAIEECFNWSLEEKKLLKMYDKFQEK